MRTSASSFEFYKSPIGGFKIRLEDGLVDQICLGRAVSKRQPAGKVKRQLHQYFSKRRRKFNLDFYLEGTDLQLKVWEKLLEIPYGETISYKELAQEVKRPRAVRAVASACGKNPLPIVIPCHRVLSSSGKLGGFSLGLERKTYLLELEQSSAR